MSQPTPNGEPTSAARSGNSSASSASQMLGGPEFDQLSPEEQARAEQMITQMAEVKRQWLAVPASQIVATHLMGFYELAATHLDQQEPDFEQAALTIDAMEAVLDVAGARLGDDGLTLRDALTVLQTMYAHRMAAANET